MAFFRDLTLPELILWMGLCFFATGVFGFSLRSWEYLPPDQGGRSFIAAMIAFVLMWRSATRLSGGLAYPLGAALFYSVTRDPIYLLLVYPFLALVYTYGIASTESRRRAINLMSIDLLEKRLIDQYKLRLGPGFITATLNVRDLCPVCRRKAFRNLEMLQDAANTGRVPEDLPQGTCSCWEPLRTPAPQAEA